MMVKYATLFEMIEALLLEGIVLTLNASDYTPQSFITEACGHKLLDYVEFNRSTENFTVEFMTGTCYIHAFTLADKCDANARKFCIRLEAFTPYN